MTRRVTTQRGDRAAHIIAIMNNKGGAGKTSTLTNLAVTMVLAGKKVLLIDGDQQANATEVLASGKKYYAQFGPTICDLYANQRFDIRDAIIPAVSGEEPIPNLSLIPSDPSFERVLENCLTRHHREKILKRHLQPILSEYDYVLIDCAPGLNLSSSNAAYVANHVLIPVDGGSFAHTGLNVVLDYLDEVKEEKFTNFSVFRNEYNASKSVMNNYLRSALETGERTKNHLLESKIRVDENIAQAQVACVPLHFYKKSSLVLNDYRSMMREIDVIMQGGN